MREMKAASKELTGAAMTRQNPMGRLLAPGFLIAVLALSIAAPVTAQEPWHPGLIDQQTRAVATQARRQFEHCIVEQLEKLSDVTETDPRDTTNQLINQCTDALAPISQAHQQINVPERFTRQFISKIKSGFVRQLLPMMQRRAAAAG